MPRPPLASSWPFLEKGGVIAWRKFELNSLEDPLNQKNNYWRTWREFTLFWRTKHHIQPKKGYKWMNMAKNVSKSVWSNLVKISPPSPLKKEKSVQWLDDIRTDLVQKVGVVRDHHQRALRHRAQVLREPLHGVFVLTELLLGPKQAALKQGFSAKPTGFEGQTRENHPFLSAL